MFVLITCRTFQAFDRGGKGYISEEELVDILHRAFGMSDVDVHHLFVQVDSDADGKIIYGKHSTNWQ